jgi:hypothetical protein
MDSDGLRARVSPATAALCAAVAAAATLLLVLDSRLTFVADDWELLIHRRELSVGSVMRPFHEHIVLAPVLVYKLLLQLFGMGSALPFYAVSTALFAASAVLLFVFARRRVGDGLALSASVLLLFLGAASEDLLWAFQMGFFGSAVAGLGMLVALDRPDRRGDRVACLLLLVSLCFSSLGLAFAAGALVDLLLGPRPRRRRAYVPLVPLAAYACWWAGWGHTAASHLSLHNVVGLPLFVFDSAAAGLASLLGLEAAASGDPTHPAFAFRALLAVCVVALAVWFLRRAGRPSRGFAVALAIAVAFWVLAGLDRDALRFATTIRYQYPSALFLLLIAAESFAGARLPRPAFVVTSALVAFSVIGGVSLLLHEYSSVWRPKSERIRTALGTVELAGTAAHPGFAIGLPDPTRVRASAYLQMTARYGSPAYPPSRLPGLPRDRRSEVDAILSKALAIRLRSLRSLAEPTKCPTVVPPGAGFVIWRLGPGQHTLVDRGPGPATVRLGRFADGEGVALGEIEMGSADSLVIPPDGSPQEWRLALTGSGAVGIC